MGTQSILETIERFPITIEANQRIYWAVRVDDLTAVCTAHVSHRHGAPQFKPEIGVVPVLSDTQDERALSEAIAARGYPILPYFVPRPLVLKTIIENGKVSDEVLDDITDHLDRYTMSKQDALDLIERGEDRRFRSYKEVYRERFDNWVTDKLKSASA
jgi:hypothetical protein